MRRRMSEEEAAAEAMLEALVRGEVWKSLQQDEHDDPYCFKDPNTGEVVVIEDVEADHLSGRAVTATLRGKAIRPTRVRVKFKIEIE